MTKEQDQLDELWVYDAFSSRVHQASMIDPARLAANLGESRRIRWTRQDGRELSGALLLPTGYRTGTRVPLVTWVYGGANSAMHILATRGFAVFFPDAPYRTGQLTNDLVASVLSGIDAVVEQGVADPERLAVMGQSFGSLNVLQLLTRTSRFKAAVISAAVLHPDLFADYLTDVGYYERGQGNQGGSIWEYPERFRANSPLFEFPRISTPLLILQGAADRDLRASSAIFTALERLGKRVELRIYPGEGHVITGPAHVRDAWEKRIEFPTEHPGLPRLPSR